MINFFPKNPQFFDLFEDLSSIVHQSGRELYLLGQKRHQASIAFKKMHKLEHEADDICHTIYREASITFITPIDREDLQALGKVLDDIVDYIENVCANVVIFNIGQPTKNFVKLTVLIKETTEKVDRLVRLISFNSKKAKEMHALMIEIHSLENKGDELMRSSLKTLFRDQKNPTTIIKWKDLYEELENILDKCEETSDIVEGIIVNNF
ncbi:DUF47 family protein [Candidatus Microgenomates bacterium]|nr:DUF47 family protein [Candidatus Microgenomates bacterium]